MLQADKVFVNGNVLTMDAANPKAGAVAVAGRMIIGVGSSDELKVFIGPQTKVIDLGGKTMIPAFNDSHNHLMYYGMNLSQVELTPEKCPDIATMKKLIAKRAAKVGPGKWIQGWGWDETRMSDGRRPSAEDMDEAAPDNPVFIARACAHVVLVNSKSFELAGITKDTPDPSGGEIVRDANGEATGILQELSAQNLVKVVIPPTTKDEAREAIAAACKVYNSYGITSVSDAGYIGSIENEMAAWYEARFGGQLSCRVSLLSLNEQVWDAFADVGVLSDFGDDMFRFGYCKFLMDGSLGGATAYMTQKYLTPPYSYGIGYLSEEETIAKVKKINDRGFKVSTHCIGDRAIEIIVSAMEKALAEKPHEDHRFRLEHGSLCRPDLQDRICAAKIGVTTNPVFLYFFGKSHVDNIGDRVKDEFPMKSFLQKGVHFSIGSDCPVLTAEPKYGLYGAVARKSVSGESLGNEERISKAQALYAYTAASAYMTFEDDIKGTIVPGKLADLAVLNFDPTVCEDDELLALQNQLTVLGGQIIYEA